MRKYNILCLLIVIAILFSSCNTTDENHLKETKETETLVSVPCRDDSLSIPPEELVMLPTEKTGFVVKIYSSIFIYDFAGAETIDKILHDRAFEKFVVGEDQYDEEPIVYNLFDDSVCEIKKEYGISWGSYYLFGLAPYYDEILASAAIFKDKDTKGITVSKIYCLDGTSSHEAAMIYFETDQGDYIFYRRGRRAEYPPYLFPIDTFYEMAEAVYIKTSDTESNGMTGLESVYSASDLKPYLVSGIGWE